MKITSCLTLLASLCIVSIESLEKHDADPSNILFADANDLDDWLSTFHGDNARMLQGHVSCRKADHGAMFICDRTHSNGDYSKYTIPCDTEYFDPGTCLTNGKKVCYQYNSIPCIASKFCFESTMYAMDCSNRYATSTGAACGITDCNSQCSVAPELLDYNQHSTPSLNACWTAGATSTATASEWTHILGDGVEIQVTVAKVNGQATSCTAQVPNQGSCSCSTDCPDTGDFSSVRYDCSAFSSDTCAVMACNGVCAGDSVADATDNFPAPAPVKAPAAPSVPRVPVSIIVDEPVAEDIFPAPIPLLKPVPMSNPYVKPVQAPVSNTAVIFTPGNSASAPVVESPVAVAPVPVPRPVAVPTPVNEGPMNSPRVPITIPVPTLVNKPAPDPVPITVPSTVRTSPVPPAPVPVNKPAPDPVPITVPFTVRTSPVPPAPVPVPKPAPDPVPVTVPSTSGGNTFGAVFPDDISLFTSQCQQHTSCKKFEGLCCPTLKGVFLECCSQDAPSPSTAIKEDSKDTPWWWWSNTNTTRKSSIQTEQVSPVQVSLASAAATGTMGVVAIVISAMMMM